MLLKDYNESLKHPVDDDVINAILARQLTATTKAATEPTIWDQMVLSWHEPALWLQSMISSKHEWLIPVAQKIVTKWWGRQGRPFPSTTLQSTLLAEYDVKRHSDIRSIITPAGLAHFRKWLRPILSAMASDPMAVLTPSNQVFTKILHKEKSSTGFRGFTTKDSRAKDVLVASAICTEIQSFEQDPLIVWYRDMRQKFRLIFASSLSHLFVFERYHAKMLRDYLSTHNSVFYHSELRESYLNEKFKRRTSKSKQRVVVECDYEMMDAHCSYVLCRDVMNLVFQIAREEGLSVPSYVVEEFMSMLEVYFSAPLLDLDGNVIFPSNGHWNLLSGVGPTNGIENYINAFTQCMALGLAEMLTGCRTPSYRLSVMGDDSALSLAADDSLSHFVEVFVDQFELVSAACGLSIQRQKQAISQDAYCFCRRYYPVNLDARGFKRIQLSDAQVPIPIYPVEYSLNSLRYPEDSTLCSGMSRTFPDVPLEEVKKLIELLDNSYGDPRHASLLNRLTQNLDLEILCDDLMQTTKHRQTWRSKVYGEGGLYVTSPTLQTLLARYKSKK